MIDLLLANPLLLLFVVAALGYPLGHIKVRGSSLGVAAVLFVGLAMGSLHPDLKLPEVIYSLGLVLFVYTIGLSSAHGFFDSLQRKGLRYNLLAVGVILFGALMAAAAHSILRLNPALTSGLFAGSLTNTPALAGVLEYVKISAPAASLDQMLAEPVIGYSITYPMGVVAMILCHRPHATAVEGGLRGRSPGNARVGLPPTISSTARSMLPARRPALSRCADSGCRTQLGRSLSPAGSVAHRLALVTGDVALRVGDRVAWWATGKRLKG